MAADDDTAEARLNAALASDPQLLTELDLSNNNLRKQSHGLRVLPPDIAQFCFLETLDLQCNLLTKIPKEIGDCKRLVELNLHNNELETIPKELGKLNMLKTIDLSNNKLANPGDIFAIFDGLRLEKIRLKLHPLETLDLEKNPMCDGLPKGTHNLGFLAWWEEHSKNDPILALQHRPPLPITAEDFDTWQTSTQERFLAALLKMVSEWAFKPPIDEDDWRKWVYFEKHVVPLSDVWADSDHFKQLQAIAKTCKGELEAECRAVVSAMANDGADGKFLCEALDPIDGDIASGTAGERRKRATSSPVRDTMSSLAEQFATLGSAESDDAPCWLPAEYVAAVKALPATETAKSKFDRDVLPTALRCLAETVFDAFRDALQEALPDAYLEPDHHDPGDGHEEHTPPDTTTPGSPSGSPSGGSSRKANSLKHGKAEPPPGALIIQCVRCKSVKGVSRMRDKVKKSQDDAAKGKGSDVWPFTATIGDALRASVIAEDAAGVRRAWECIRDSDLITVIKLKNKFRTAASNLQKSATNEAVYTADLKEGKRTEFPNLHINVLFQAEGCAPIVAEIQIHHKKVKKVNDQDHKLYEVIRAETINALSSSVKVTVIENKDTVKKHDTLKKKHEDLERKTINWDNEINALKTKASEGGTRVKSLEIELDGAQAECKALEEKNLSLKKEVEALKAEAVLAEGVVRGPSTTLVDGGKAAPVCPPPCVIL